MYLGVKGLRVFLRWRSPASSLKKWSLIGREPVGFCCRGLVDDAE